MLASKKVAGDKAFEDSIGPALKESGLEFLSISSADEWAKAQAECFLFDARDQRGWQNIAKLKSRSRIPIISMVPETIDRSDLLKLKTSGAESYVSEKTPAEEVVVRIRAMLFEKKETHPMEARAARRYWFQENVKFKIFDRWHNAWSTTLSETGIFLRTNLSFPLYSTIQLQFHLLGDPQPFECQGVIVRQEVEGEIRGLGVMFQNLSGESVRRLESFLEIYR